MKGYYNGVWAGSLRYHDGMFYCHFATPRGGWFVAITTDIRGKWELKAMRDCNGRELRGRGGMISVRYGMGMDMHTL